jgi:hypothetical protein
MKLDILQSDFERCGFNPIIKTQTFSLFKSLPKVKGLYSIWQEDTCIYVGQGGGRGGIRARFDHHHNKAYAIFETNKGTRNGTQDGAGWKEGRSNDWWTPEHWTVEYFECPRAVHRTYLEGVMMLVLNPFCNDESFEDRLI